jgi:beta-glucosidase
MGAYNRTNGEVCCAHSYLMDDVLRGQWDFQGHYVSDCGAIRDFHESHKVTSRPEESVTLALEKGCDMNCGCTYEKILNAYEEGMISKEVLRRSAIRVMTTRFLLGMFDETEYDAIPYTCVESKEHLNLAREAAEESIVLLKNDGILPLEKKEGMVIGVIGPNANNRRSLDGNYHGTSSRYITALEGLQDYVGEDIRILYSQGAHLSKDRDEALAYKHDRISEALTVAEHSDVIILCVGLDETLEGEEGDDGNAYFSGDKKDLSLPEGQKKLVEVMLECGKPVVLCMFAGSSMDLDLADEKANAILQTWYLGCQGGTALAKILFGEISPSGKLPITLYSTKNVIPDFEDYSMKGRTYRYLEEKPLYPFGYGLTYSRIEVKDIESVLDENKNLRLKVTVENTGNRFTKDVLEAYVKNKDSEYAPLNPVLCGFKKISLDKGEERTYDIEISSNAFLVVNEDGEKILDSSSARIYVSTSGVDERSEELTGNSPKVVELEW